MKTYRLGGMSRRAILIGVAGIPLIATGAANATQLKKGEIGYQPSPKNGKKCDQCKFFVAPKSCKYVAGAISPEGWCELWVAKDG
jgi:hypothetical protein